MSYSHKAQSILKKNKFKCTPSRLAILDILDKTSWVVSFHDIVKMSPDKKLDDVTVYRFLQILEDLHLVKKITSLRWYITCDGWTHDHNHYFLVCNWCNDVQEKVVTSKQKEDFSLLGIHPDHKCLEIVWKCWDCSQK